MQPKLFDLLKDSDLDNNIDNNYLGKNLRVKKIMGYIYRGDTHDAQVLSLNPKFYGSRESAEKYTRVNEYLKRYTTMKELTLLDLSNTKENISNIIAFFNNIIKTHGTINNKMSLLLLQMLFGLVHNVFIHTDLTKDEIKDYLEQREISRGNMIYFFEIKNKLLASGSPLIPSRCSIRPFDQILMINLKNILKPFNIDGIFYLNKDNYDDKNNLCRKLTKYYNANLCVPSEICVFNPADNLGGVIFWKRTKTGFVNIKKHEKYKKQIRDGYHGMSLAKLYSMSTADQ